MGLVQASAAIAAALLLSFALAACGGGGDDTDERCTASGSQVEAAQCDVAGKPIGPMPSCTIQPGGACR
jgi:hypothetical protein